LAKVKPEELRRLKGKAIHVPFEPYLREIKALNIEGAISIELEYSPEPSQITEWVAEAYRATDRLMQQAGLRG
jgi:sugar phosphate isomerase/epimerase